MVINQRDDCVPRLGEDFRTLIHIKNGIFNTVDLDLIKMPNEVPGMMVILDFDENKNPILIKTENNCPDPRGNLVCIEWIYHTFDENYYNPLKKWYGSPIETKKGSKAWRVVKVLGVQFGGYVIDLGRDAYASMGRYLKYSIQRISKAYNEIKDIIKE